MVRIQISSQMKIMTVDEQLQVLLQGTETVVSPDELRAKLGQRRPLRVKLGCDPTAPDLHLGHSVVLRKLRQFQDCGHIAVLIIGDYTARIGDPTGQNETRPILDEAAIARNAQTYFEQAGQILDTAPGKLEIRRNSEWLAPMTFADVIRLTGRMTVARMLERDTFQNRHQSGEPIGIHEFLYPLMQGHDSVMIRADVELGGTDQTFNNLVGRDLQRDAGQEPQVVMILPILEGLDGVEKMSKSKGNYIGLHDPPMDVHEKREDIQGIYSKVMGISDELMWRWYRLLLDKTSAEVAQLQQDHPMEVKKRLARTIVAQYHDAEAAAQAEEQFKKLHSERQVRAFARVVPAIDSEIGIIELMERAWRFSSRSEIRRLVREGAVSLDGQKITDEKVLLRVTPGQILRAGPSRVPVKFA